MNLYGILFIYKLLTEKIKILSNKMGNSYSLKASPRDRPSFNNRLTYADIPQAETTIPETKS